jgi:mono/diheme cytochrome c family protein
MKLRNRLLTVGTMIALTSFATAADRAEVLFDTKCASCHSKTKPTDMDKVLAPALMGVMRHVKMTYPNKDEAVKFMVDYILEPTKEKAICMPQKIERFGLMPSQKGNVTEAELTQITSWMFDNFPPAGFRGMGQGNRKGQGN